MVQSFKSPAFSGIGYSAHELTIENLARTRKQTLKDIAKSEVETAKVTAQNTRLITSLIIYKPEFTLN